MDRDGTSDAELEERLRAYASERLSPDPAWSASTRAQLVALAERQAPAPAPVAIEPARRRRDAERAARPVFLAAFRRRAVAGLLAASLAVVSVGVVFAADPGTALYPARLWLESITLPANATGSLGRLDRRIEDAKNAASHGQGAAVSAALEAYRASLLDAIAAAGDDPERLRHLHDELDAHAVVLETLAGSVPAGAGDAITETIKANADASRRAGETPRPDHTTKP